MPSNGRWDLIRRVRVNWAVPNQSGFYSMTRRSFHSLPNLFPSQLFL